MSLYSQLCIAMIDLQRDLVVVAVVVIEGGGWKGRLKKEIRPRSWDEPMRTPKDGDIIRHRVKQDHLNANHALI